MMLKVKEWLPRVVVAVLFGALGALLVGVVRALSAGQDGPLWSVLWALWGAAVTWLVFARPRLARARRREAGLRDAVDDLGDSIGALTRVWADETSRLGRRVEESVRAEEDAELRARIALLALVESGRVNARLRHRLEEAEVAARLALVFYGKEVARADAAEQAEVDHALCVPASSWWESPGMLTHDDVARRYLEGGAR